MLKAGGDEKEIKAMDNWCTYGTADLQIWLQTIKTWQLHTKH